MRLERKVALVTGGGSGIGRGIAERFAREGAAVVVSGRRSAVLEETVTTITRSGGRALAVPGSVAVEADVRSAVAATLETFGQLDILVNNAGGTVHRGPLHELSDAAWSESLDVFVTGAFRCLRAALPHMIARGGGTILNIGSVAGLKVIPALPTHAYAVAKAGLVMLTTSVAVHYARDNVRCNCICPGVIDTRSLAHADATRRAAVAALHPLGRLGTVEEVAELAVYLASDDARWITGSVVTIDGGVSAQ
jgi:NAD(P)-dependent dehydrogenase (short-subunit alcohol dehydrogenase family)